MKHTKLGCCYFPTNVIFIDDNDKFLENVIMGLDSTKFKFNAFTQVRRFEHYLAPYRSQLKSIPWAKATDNLANYNERDKHEIAINFHFIYKQIYNLNRYDEISVAVVDYAMPQGNGIELCKFIRTYNPHIKILLLTGEADDEIAVNAFNNKLIDNFTRKESMDTLVKKLKVIIAELAQDYFRHILDGLNANLINPNLVLETQAFLDVFQSIYDQHNAREYYLIDPSGGYLMLNGEGEVKWLVLKNKDDIQTYTELALSEEHLNKEVLTRINQKELLPFYHGEYLNLPIEHWEKHMLPAHKLPTTLGNYLYATDETLAHSIIEQDRVQGFNEYRRKK